MVFILLSFRRSEMEFDFNFSEANKVNGLLDLKDIHCGIGAVADGFVAAVLLC